jgi:hypothetical protein
VPRQCLPSLLLGGKVLTRWFERLPAHYEAGAAEWYDYSVVGPDPGTGPKTCDISAPDEMRAFFRDKAR